MLDASLFRFFSCPTVALDFLPLMSTCQVLKCWYDVCVREFQGRSVSFLFSIENSIPRAKAVVPTGDDFRTYINPEDVGTYIVLRHTTLTLNCSASGEGIFGFSWSRLTDNGFELLPGENTSLLRVMSLQSDVAYECRVRNPLITTRQQNGRAIFSLTVVGKFRLCFYKLLGFFHCSFFPTWCKN